MRPIVKNAIPSCLADWISGQCKANLTTDYYAFDNALQLKRDLLLEQFGLCAYTGRAVVDWQVTVEHLKPYSMCKQEKEAAGQQVGEDVDYDNLVATYKVYIDKPVTPTNGHYPDNLYGEAVRGNWFDADYVSPLEETCGSHFNFDLNGGIESTSTRGEAMVTNLRLDHPRLTEDRRAAIDATLDDLADELNGGGSVETFLAKVCTVVADKLPSFSFVLESALLQFT